MLTLAGISKSYNNNSLFSGLSFTVSMHDRIAVIGRNGSGKTTLFEIITGKVAPDAGSLSLRRGTTIGYLRQDVNVSSDRKLLDEVSGSSDVINRLEHKINLIQEDLAAEKDSETISELLEELGKLQELYESKGGYSSEHEAKIILSGLGFIQVDFSRPLSEFSGGWKTRIELARLLFLNPDILLLDEPTNHLDLETQRWFENLLKHYHGAVLVTSHDRAFLNNTVHKIIAIEAEDVIFYHGSYDDYVLARQKDLEIRQSSARRQEINIGREMRFIERFRAKATKASQVQSRIKKLEKIERISVPRSINRIHFKFPDPLRSGRNVIELQHVGKSYGENRVYRDLNLVLERGDRAAIIGVNGAGKTTLLRILADVLPFESGKRILGHNVTTSYFAQYYIESLNPNNTIIEEIRNVASDESDQFLRGVLGAFLFSGDDVDKKIAVLSGGEKTRVAIARMLTRPANLLLLDEPTNHLDIPSREILSDALDAYHGTICFITHDRTLVREIANKIIEVKHGHINVFPGSYDEFLQQVKDTEEAEAQPADRQKSRASGIVNNRQRRELEGNLRNQHYRAIAPINRRVAEIEQESSEIGERLKEIESLMSNPDHYKDSAGVIAVNQEYRDLRERLAVLTKEWDSLTDKAERMKLDFLRAKEAI